MCLYFLVCVSVVLGVYESRCKQLSALADTLQTQEKSDDCVVKKESAVKRPEKTALSYLYSKKFLIFFYFFANPGSARTQDKPGLSLRDMVFRHRGGLDKNHIRRPFFSVNCNTSAALLSYTLVFTLKCVFEIWFVVSAIYCSSQWTRPLPNKNKTQSKTK